MASPEENDRDDPFAPPQPPMRVCCLHCGNEFDSDEIVYRPRPNIHGPIEHGMTGDWCCPTPGCDGVGYGFDIVPSDQDWEDQDGNGWHQIEDEDDESDPFNPDSDDFMYSGLDVPQDDTTPFWKHDPSVLRPADAPDDLNVDIDAEVESPLERMFEPEPDDQDIPF
jgi:hypothetical protein